jgi:hypothetical protein
MPGQRAHIKTHLEYQVSENVNGFELVITLTGLTSWTSRPARLEAETWEQAMAEAAGQVRALRAVLELPED